MKGQGNYETYSITRDGKFSEIFGEFLIFIISKNNNMQWSDVGLLSLYLRRLFLAFSLILNMYNIYKNMQYKNSLSFVLVLVSGKL